MFLTYLRRELRRRIKQSLVVAVGLAIGIGLVMTISATSAGVKAAQGEVLHALYGVGTDMTVTRTVAPSSLRFGGSHSGASSSTPAAGTHISREALRPASGEGTLPSSDVKKVASLRHVAAATGGLVLTDTKFSGTIPSSSGTGSPSYSRSSSYAGPSFTITSFSVDGVQISKSQVGPITASEVTKGRYFRSSENTAQVAIVSSTYATQESLKVGSKLKIVGKSISVIGVAQVSSGSSDIFLPLGTAQKLAGLKGEVTIIYVSASSSSIVSAVAAEIERAIPKVTVTTSADLAKEVTGSLADAATLATNLGKWLSIVALIVAFLVAALLMLAAVSRRVQEFGTLRAIGWRARRIVEQVMGEGLTLGILGGIAGVVLGLAASAVITAVSPSLSATVGPTYATGGFPGASSFPSRAHAAYAAAHTVLVHLTAPLQGGTVGLAVLLAVAGGLIAGFAGALRAARLRPAAALRRIE